MIHCGRMARCACNWHLMIAVRAKGHATAIVTGTNSVGPHRQQLAGVSFRGLVKILLQVTQKHKACLRFLWPVPIEGSLRNVHYSTSPLRRGCSVAQSYVSYGALSSRLWRRRGCAAAARDLGPRGPQPGAAGVHPAIGLPWGWYCRGVHGPVRGPGQPTLMPLPSH